MHTQFPLEEIAQWVFEKLMQSSGIPTQSNAHMQTKDPTPVMVSSQLNVRTSPSIPAQSSMFSQANMPTQSTEPTHSQQMGFSLLLGTFPHFTGHISVPLGAYPS